MFPLKFQSSHENRLPAITQRSARRLVAGLTAVLGLSVLAPSAGAQTLVERVPAEATVYASWRGSDNLGESYAGSKAEAIAKESNFMKLLDETLPRLIADRSKVDLPTAAVLQSCTTIGKTLLRKPTALYFIPGDKKTVRGGLIVKTGKGVEATKLLAEMLKISKVLPPEVRARAFVDGDIVALVLGYDDGVMALPGAGANRPAALTTNERFLSAMKQVDADPVTCVFVDIEKTKEVLVDLLEADAPSNFDQVLAVYKELGFDSLRSLAFTQTFKDRDWVSRTFVDAPAPRQGLFATSDSKPFDPALMTRVPASSVFATFLKGDLATTFANLHKAVVTTNPAAAQSLDNGLNQLKQAMGGKDLQQDILQPLGGQWAIYNSPEIGGFDPLGMVVVNKLANPAEAAESLNNAADALNALSASLTRGRDFSVSGAKTTVGDLTVYYIAIPSGAPSFAIHDGYLYASFFPQNVVAAARYSGQGIKENEKFTKVMNQLEMTTGSFIRFDDVDAYLPSGYALTQLLTRAGLGVSDMFAVQTPEMVLPPLPTFVANAGPAGTVGWWDDAGYHQRNIQPFPAATTIAELTPMNLMSANPAMAMSILLPSLNRAREAANRIKSASNMKQIGLTLMMATNRDIRTGAYPADLQKAAAEEELEPEVFDSPMGDAPGGDYLYLYFPGLTNSASADTMILVDRADLMGGKGTNVLFADLHVDWLTVPQFWQAVEKSRKVSPGSAPAAMLGR